MKIVIKNCFQQLTAQEAELVQERCRAAELGRQLKACMEVECKERRRREELETQRTIDRNICEEERLRAVKEVTDQLNHDHRLEMEAVRLRFRQIATATMERSPSECSLEKIEVDCCCVNVMIELLITLLKWFKSALN